MPCCCACLVLSALYHSVQCCHTFDVMLICLSDESTGRCWPPQGLYGIESGSAAGQVFLPPVASLQARGHPEDKLHHFLYCLSCSVPATKLDDAGGLACGEHSGQHAAWRLHSCTAPVPVGCSKRGGRPHGHSCLQQRHVAASGRF